MRGKELFNAVIRLAGLYMLLQALSSFLLLLFIGQQVHSGDGAPMALVFFQSIVGQGLIGYYFFARGHRVTALAFAAEESEDSSAT